MKTRLFKHVTILACLCLFSATILAQGPAEPGNDPLAFRPGIKPANATFLQLWPGLSNNSSTKYTTGRRKEITSEFDVLPAISPVVNQSKIFYKKARYNTSSVTEATSPMRSKASASAYCLLQ